MSGNDRSPALEQALREAQRLGFLGSRPVPETIAHADAFVRALRHVQGPVLDLGSGGGVPGLVIADRRPDLPLVLLDRRQKRADALERAVRRLGWSDRVQVLCDDAHSVAQSSRWRHTFHGVVARGFGPPDATLRVAADLVAPGGLVVISEPPPHQGDRWADRLPTGWRRTDDGTDGVAVLVAPSTVVPRGTPSGTDDRGRPSTSAVNPSP